jgi:alpha-beta hydrolase superfamily lysophospholipase
MEWIEANGASLRYDLSGGGAETVVLPHEVGGCIESWDDTLPAFQRHFRVLRYDQRGFGLSEKTRVITMDAVVRDWGNGHIEIDWSPGYQGPFEWFGRASGSLVAEFVASLERRDGAEIARRRILEGPAHALIDAPDGMRKTAKALAGSAVRPRGPTQGRGDGTVATRARPGAARRRGATPCQRRPRCKP